MQDVPTMVSIIVPCRNEKAYITQCVQSILRQDFSAGDDFEIILADGMSNDGTREILTLLKESDTRIRVIDNPDCIVSAGLNAAIRVAQGNVIIRMDVHTEYASDYVHQCLKVLKETGADNVGGPWVAKGKGLVSQSIAAAFQSPFGVGGARGHNPEYEGLVDTVYLGCWPREIFDRVGLFDEGFVRNQDDEFNFRLSRIGGKIWQSPRIKSWYFPRSSLKTLFQQYLQYGYWKVRVIQKHKRPASLRHLIPPSFVFLLTILPLLSLRWPVAGWGWLGLVGMYGIANLTASFMTSARNGWKIFLLLPIVFGSYHLAYGWGFLRGIWDFVILGRTAGPTYTNLTRGTTNSK